MMFGQFPDHVYRATVASRVVWFVRTTVVAIDAIQYKVVLCPRFIEMFNLIVRPSQPIGRVPDESDPLGRGLAWF